MNSVILIMDRTIGDVPESMNDGLVSATSSCVAVGTLSEFDGETSITLTNDSTANKPQGHPVFDGHIDTPSGRLSICSITDEPLIECEVAKSQTKVLIWVNDELEPDEIYVAVKFNSQDIT